MPSWDDLMFKEIVDRIREDQARTPPPLPQGYADRLVPSAMDGSSGSDSGSDSEQPCFALSWEVARRSALSLRRAGWQSVLAEDRIGARAKLIRVAKPAAAPQGDLFSVPRMPRHAEDDMSSSSSPSVAPELPSNCLSCMLMTIAIACGGGTFRNAGEACVPAGRSHSGGEGEGEGRGQGNESWSDSASPMLCTMYVCTGWIPTTTASAALFGPGVGVGFPPCPLTALAAQIGPR